MSQDHIVEVRYTQVAGDTEDGYVKQQVPRWLNTHTGELFDNPDCWRGACVGSGYYPGPVIGAWVNGIDSRVAAVAGACVTVQSLPTQEPDLKFDEGKPRWSLLMQGLAKSLAGIVAVLTFGAKKYAAHSWRNVQNGQERYKDALYRHLHAIESGELTDPESGCSHWSHVATNALFLHELEIQNAK